MRASKTPLLRAAGALCGLLLGLLGTVAALGATPTYVHESEQAYKQQLAGGQIQAASINKRLQTIRITLKDGSHVLAKYPKHQEPQVRHELEAKRVAVTVLTPAQAEKQAKALPVHHKLRYILGGVLLGLVVVGGGVLLYRRYGERD